MDHVVRPDDRRVRDLDEVDRDRGADVGGRALRRAAVRLDRRVGVLGGVEARLAARVTRSSGRRRCSRARVAVTIAIATAAATVTFVPPLAALHAGCSRLGVVLPSVLPLESSFADARQVVVGLLVDVLVRAVASTSSPVAVLLPLGAGGAGRRLGVVRGEPSAAKLDVAGGGRGCGSGFDST